MSGKSQTEGPFLGPLRAVTSILCFEVTREAGYNDVAEELERIHDSGEWTKYAIDRIELVREIAQEHFDPHRSTRGLIRS
jgi:hypothetical protein